MAEDINENLEEKCRALVQRDRKRRPWMIASIIVLVITWLLTGGNILHEIFLVPSVCFAVVAYFRWWSNLFCPKCHRSLLSRTNPYRFFGMWSSDECICYFCRTHIPFDEEKTSN